MESGAPSLSFEHVAMALGGRPILRDIDFRLERGEMVGLLGRNGAGKTSLLRLVSGGLRPDSGSIFLGERDVESFSRRELAREIATVPQDLHVPFPYLAGELVLMGRTPHQKPFGFESPDDLRLARQAMERVGIADLADRPIDRLSGGERQLVLFARALAQEPNWLLLDEPTAFLDLRHRIDLLAVVRDFVGGGRGGALVVSHDLALAARVCDRIVVLSEGRVLAQGAPSDVLDPDLIESAFGMEAEVVSGPDGRPLVVPRMARPEGR